MGNQIKNIFLFVGLNKTGSTSIQNTLFNAHDQLKSFGFYYPKNWAMNHNVHIMSVCLNEPEKYPVNIKNGRITKEAVAVFNHESKASLLAELAEADQENLILCGEGISFLPKDGVIRLKAFLEEIAPNAEVHILFVFRELISILASDYQQKVKSGKSVDELFNAMHTISYKERAQKFIDVFGQSQVIGYAFEEALQHPQGIMGKFCEVIGVPSDFYAGMSFVQKNEGISDKAVDLISYVNEQVPLKDENGYVVKGRFHRDTFLLHQIKGDKFRLSKEMVEVYLKHNEDDLNWLKETFEIDYSVIENQPVRQESVYDAGYVAEIKRFFPLLPSFVQGYVRDYLVQLSEQVEDSESKENLTELKEWLLRRKFWFSHLLPNGIYRWGYEMIRKLKGI